MFKNSLSKIFFLFALLIFFASYASADMMALDLASALASASIALFGIIFIIDLLVNVTILFLSQKFFAKNFFQKFPLKKIFYVLFAITIVGLILDFLAGFIFSSAALGLLGYWLGSFAILLIANLAITLYFGFKPKQAMAVSLPLAAISNPVIGLVILSILFSALLSLGILVAIPIFIICGFYSLKKIGENRPPEDALSMKKFYNILGIILLGIILVLAVALFFLSIFVFYPPVMPPSDLGAVTRHMIQQNADRLGELETSSILTFNYGSNLAPLALVGTTGLSADQICLHKGDLVDTASLEIHGKTLVNAGAGTTNLQIKVSVTCNYSKDLVQSLKSTGFGNVAGSLNDGENGFCSCPIDDETSNKKCCVVILRYA